MNSNSKWVRIGSMALMALFIATGLVALAGSLSETPAVRADAAPASNAAVTHQQQAGSCIEGTVVDLYHEPVAGWTVRCTLKMPGGPQYTTVTDKHGRFTFAGLTAGTWTLTQELQEGWEPFTPPTFDVTVNGLPGACAQVRFKNQRLVTVIGRKTECKFGLGLAGWVIEAIPVLAGGQTITTTTNGLGQYQFNHLIPGTWIFREVMQEGWESYSPLSGQWTVTLVSPRSTTPPTVLNFVNNQVTGPRLKVCKIDELGRGLSGWQISARPANGTRPPIYGVTGHDGCVVFSKGLDFGSWIVEEHPTSTQSQEWCPTTPTKVTVELTTAGQTVSVTFQNKPCGCVRVRKVNTLHQGLAGWIIYARKGDMPEISQVTDSQGYATFRNLEFGTWTFREEVKPGWTPVTPAQVEVPVSRQGRCEEVLFKNETRTAMLVVYKKDWYGRVGLPGWTITVQPKYGGTPQSQVTDGTGRVEFTDLAPGWYIVSEQSQPGWWPVTSSSVTLELKVTGAPAEHVFWNRQVGVTPQPGPQPGPGTWYIVQRGDTLSSIAARFGSSVHAIASANGLYYPYIIYVGQRLRIP